MSSHLDYIAQLLDLATLKMRNQEYEEALQKYKECLEFFRSSGDRVNEGKTLSQIGRICEQRGELEKAIHLQRQSLVLNESSDSEEDRAKILLRLAILLLKRGQRGDQDQAARYLEDADVHAEQSNNKRLQASIIHVQAMILALRDDFKKAHHRLIDSLEISESLNDREGVAVSVYEIGRVLLELAMRVRAQDPPFADEILADAERNFRRSYEMFRPLQKRDGMAMALFNLGLVHERRGNLQPALDVYRRAYALCDRYYQAGTARVAECLARLEQ